MFYKMRIRLENRVDDLLIRLYGSVIADGIEWVCGMDQCGHVNW